MSTLTIILLIILILALFFIMIMAVDTHRLIIRSYEIKNDRIKEDFSFVFLSDLHSKSFGKDNERLIKKIDDLAPDAVLIGGDMYTAAFSDKGEVAGKLIRRLCGKYPVIHANGNHEQKTRLLPDDFENIYSDYTEKLRSLGVTYIENGSTDLEDKNIRIYGLELPFRYYRKLGREFPGTDVIKECIGEADKDRFVLLLAHNPQYFDDYASWGADLTMSGHVHGGLVRLPLLGGVLSPNYRFFPKYSGGRYDIGDSTMVLSCGLGTHHIPLRIFNPAELTYVRCIKCNKT